MERLPLSAFDGDRLLRPGRWVVAFVAEWCGFCAEFLPRFAALPVPSRAHVALADVTDDDSPLWASFAIEVVPTVIGFADGRITLRADGVLGAGLGVEALEAIGRALAEAAGGSG